MRFYLIQILLFIFFLGIQFYFYRTFRSFCAQNERFRKYLAPATGAFIAFSIPIVFGMIFRIFGIGTPAWFTVHVMPPVYIWHFISVFLLGLILVGKILKIPFLTTGWILQRFERTRPIIQAVALNRKFQDFDVRRRQVVRQTLTALTGGLALGSAYEVYKKDDFEKTDIRIPIKNLPDSFHNFSIGFISDVHSGIFMSGERMRKYAEAVNALKTDLIVVTGDFVNGQLDEAYPFREAFGILSAEHGVYGVLGNHDFYSRKVEDVVREIEKGGLSILRNRSLTLTKNGESINLAGVDDTGSEETAARYIRGVAGRSVAGLPKILLCHRPYFFHAAAASGFDLTLSGHTHGGQVVLGGRGKDVLAPARMVSPYVAGLYTEGAAKMYISRGIGTVGVPFRFNCPPEITKIVLERDLSA